MDFNHAGFVHFRATVTIGHGDRRQRRQRVRARNRLRRPRDARHGRSHFLAEPFKEFVFQRGNPFGGGQNRLFQIFQFLRDKTFPVDERLFPYIAFGHLVLERVRDFDIIAEHLIISDFQRTDSGCLPFFGLHFGDNPLAAVQDMPQAVHLRIVAVPNKPAFPYGHGRLIAQRFRNPGGQVLQRVHSVHDFLDQPVRKRRQTAADFRDFLHGRP